MSDKQYKEIEGTVIDKACYESHEDGLLFSFIKTNNKKVPFMFINPKNKEEAKIYFDNFVKVEDGIGLDLYNCCTYYRDVLTNWRWD